MALTYYIPDWDDRVDPDYNFIEDSHTPNRVPYRDDRYAHELYQTPPYDGVLLSRAVLDADRTKHERITEIGSVHSYLRLPSDHTVLGDCGAFSYWREEVPPYATPEMLEYYQTLGFDYGVAIDHLIFAEHADERQRRWDITQHNNEEFLRQHQRGGYRFTPIGVAQGWDPASYARAVDALMKMSYDYIAIGGLVRSQTSEILRILQATQEHLRPGVRVHLFGVSRPEQVPTFAALGVTSFDSASRLRRAWMDGRRNYFLGDTAYTAIRIPTAESLVRRHNTNPQTTEQLEQAALNAMRSYDRGTAALEETLTVTLEYAALSAPVTDRVKQDYRDTLVAKPWQRCSCSICVAVGVEVIIFRGNNRNRRRGFHNTWQLYQQLQSMRDLDAPILEIAVQNELPM